MTTRKGFKKGKASKALTRGGTKGVGRLGTGLGTSKKKVTKGLSKERT